MTQTGAAMIRKHILPVMIVVLLPALVKAQPSKTEGLLMAMSANGKQMTAYQWKQKTTIIRKGNPAGVRIDEVRFDASGQPQRITMVQPEGKNMGPLRARKASAILNSIQEVMQLARRYADPREIGRAIRQGEVREGQWSLRVEARYLIAPVDEIPKEDVVVRVESFDFVRLAAANPF